VCKCVLPPGDNTIAVNKYINIIIIIIIIIGSTALGRPWPPQANIASVLYSGHPPIYLRYILILPLHLCLDLPSLPKPVGIIPFRIARRNTEIKSQLISSLSI
jgi:hypothetical protein